MLSLNFGVLINCKIILLGLKVFKTIAISAQNMALYPCLKVISLFVVSCALGYLLASYTWPLPSPYEQNESLVLVCTAWFPGLYNGSAVMGCSVL